MNQSHDLKDQEDTGFLQRWSQRKQDVEAAEADDAVPIKAEVELDVEPPLTDEDMPAIESLTESSDYSGFLSPQVSDELRRVALRKLFNAAVFNQRDGLDDYDDDFTSFAKLGDIITSDMQHQIDLAKEKLKEVSSEDEASDSDESQEVTTEQIPVESEQDVATEVAATAEFENDVEREL